MNFYKFLTATTLALSTYSMAEALRFGAGLLRVSGGTDRSRDRRDLVHCGRNELGCQRA